MTKSRGLIAKRGTRAAWVAAEQGRHFCGCGCGQPIQLQPVHYTIGVPRFLHGHNPTRLDRRLPPPAPCECGCGRLAGRGRRFVSGHNGRGAPRSAATKAKLRAANSGERSPHFGQKPWNYKPKPPPQPCACGCGHLATPGRRFISGHNTAGTRLSNYKGWYRSVTGYIFQEAPGHPYACKGYVLQHRLIMEAHLRETNPASPYLEQLGDQLYLRRDMTVHHRDGTKDNNAIENLECLTPGEHSRRHHEQGDIHRH